MRWLQSGFIEDKRKFLIWLAVALDRAVTVTDFDGLGNVSYSNTGANLLPDQ